MSTRFTAAPRLQVIVDVTDWTEYQRIAVLDAIKAIQADASPIPLDEVEVTGWTKELVEQAFEHLAGSKATAQIKVIKRAIDTGGFVTRKEVYELAGYESTRSLKGFTRPTNRATNKLRDVGALPEDAEELLAPKYDLELNSYQRTQGFTIPLEIVKLYST
jgi:hypothetical protein